MLYYISSLLTMPILGLSGGDSLHCLTKFYPADHAHLLAIQEVGSCSAPLCFYPTENG